eukprot:6205789-Pleurochrysis_carterae.AAC.2
MAVQMLPTTSGSQRHPHAQCASHGWTDACGGAPCGGHRGGDVRRTRRHVRPMRMRVLKPVLINCASWR